MIEQIGALADKRGGVFSDAFDDCLDRFLAELLRDLGATAGEQPSSIGTLRISAAARLNDLP